MEIEGGFLESAGSKRRGIQGEGLKGEGLEVGIK